VQHRAAGMGNGNANANARKQINTDVRQNFKLTYRAAS